MSRWPSLDRRRATGIRDVAALLLDAGADPNTTVGSRPGRPDYCSTLFGAAGCRGNAELTAMLLNRAATPDAHTVYLAAFHADRRALELLLERGAPVDDSALAAPLTTGDVDVARLILDADADAGRMIPAEALGEGDPGELPLIVAVRNGHSAELVELLLQRGADPNAPGRDGRTTHRLAVRQGRADLARALRRGGARAEVTDETEVDLFLAACLQNDRVAAEGALRRGWVRIDRLTDEDRAAIVHAADHGNLDAVRLMLELGFPIDSRGDDGTTPLHAAASAGSADVVQLLIHRGADIHARDTTFGGTPVVWASVGSGMRLGRCPNPDWVATIQLLINAGASIEDAWLTGAKTPSRDVAELLRAHGVSEPHSA
jgi:ankyrin repeat protein